LEFLTIISRMTNPFKPELNGDTYDNEYPKNRISKLQRKAGTVYLPPVRLHSTKGPYRAVLEYDLP